MSVALVVLTNGRMDCIDHSIDAALANLHGLELAPVVICDDSADDQYRAWLAQRFPEATIISDGTNLGYAGAMRRAWAAAIDAGTEYVFWLEEDFIVLRPVDLSAMALVLDERPRLTQVMLKRQAWWANEVAAGGLVEANPGMFIDASNGVHCWTEYAAFWTSPYLVRRDFLQAFEWPYESHSETMFSAKMRNLGRRGALWGRRDDPPLVEHVGIRTGKGY